MLFSRSPSNGDNELYGEYLINAQGEDVVAGILQMPEPETLNPKPYTLNLNPPGKDIDTAILAILCGPT